MESSFTRRRAGVAALLLGAVVALGGCDSLLEVNNPGAIDERDITDPLFIPEMVNAAINEFQEDFGFMVYAGAMLTDEALNGHNFTQWEDIDLRVVEDDNSQLLAIYQTAQTARGTGDDMVSRLRDVVEDPATSLPLATALTYAGYSHVMVAEYFCFAPMNDESPAVRSDAIHALAVERFQEAINITQGMSGAEAQRILNMARVGAARASLQSGDNAAAVAFATAVPADFVAWIHHAATPTNLRNYMVGETSGTNATLGLDGSFVGLNDNRVRHEADWRTGHNQKTRLYIPFQPSSYSGWVPDADVPFEYDTDIRLASGLEARYIIAEAGGMSNAEVEAFINERRTVGGQGAFTGTDLQAELREQRRRDFFLDGHRLGDLRRYRTRYAVDQFPSGPHPNDAEWGWGSYGTATCFIPHRNEGVSNPNYVPLSLD